MNVPLAPPPFLGSGEVAGRYEFRIREPKPLPWYYNQTATMMVAVGAIAVWVALVLCLA
jgi:hypothetical protein